MNGGFPLSWFDHIESAFSVASHFAPGVGSVVNGVAAAGHGIWGAVESARGNEAAAHAQVASATTSALGAIPFVGLGVSIANAVDRFDGVSDIGESILHWFHGDDDPPAATPPVAEPEKRKAVFEMAEMQGKTPQERYELAMKLIAKDIGGQGMGFADDGQVGVNTKMWQGTEDGKGIQLKDGVSPSAAMKDFLEKSDRYRLDCGMAVQMMQMSAMYEALGPEAFDETMKKNGGLSARVGGTGGALQAMSKMHREDPNADPTRRPPEAAPGSDGFVSKNARPGDTVYFDNPGATDADRRGGWGGENSIYLGEQNGERMYFAHPMGVVSETHIRDELEKRPGHSKVPVARMEELYRPELPQ